MTAKCQRTQRVLTQNVHNQEECKGQKALNQPSFSRAHTNIVLYTPKKADLNHVCLNIKNHDPFPLENSAENINTDKSQETGIYAPLANTFGFHAQLSDAGFD